MNTSYNSRFLFNFEDVGYRRKSYVPPLLQCSPRKPHETTGIECQIEFELPHLSFSRLNECLTFCYGNHNPLKGTSVRNAFLDHIAARLFGLPLRNHFEVEMIEVISKRLERQESVICGT